MPERGIAIVRFVFIFVRADSLQYLKNRIMPERDFVIVHRCSVAITLSLNDESTGLAATRCFLMFFKK